MKSIPFSPPDMTDMEAKLAAETILSGWITTGPKTKEFERRIAKMCHTQKAVCLSSATAALETALRILGVGDRDEVIVPAYTYTATCSVVCHVGARPVMVDSQSDNVQMDYERLSDAITERTKVIIPVDLGGIVCDYERIFRIVESKSSLFRPATPLQELFGRVIVVADAAHAFGAQQNGVMCGAIADFTSFSFHAVKNLTTAEGGALTWNIPHSFVDVEKVQETDYLPKKQVNETWDDYIYRLCQLFSLHGQSKDALAKNTPGSWEYDIIGPWYKCNMTDIMASLGLAQLDRYPQMLSRRREIISRYDDSFKGKGIATMNHYGLDFASSGHLYLVRILGRTREQTNDIISRMAQRGISCNVHYKPLPMMTAYKNLGYDISLYPNAYHLFENELTLPLYSKLSDDDVDYIIDNFTDILDTN